MTYQGQIHNLNASSEIVLSVGAVHTPKVLMQSGVGDEKEWQRFGIPVLPHLPGVGRNYHHHVGFDCVWEFREPPASSYLGESMVFWHSTPELESPDLFLAEGPFPKASPENAKRFGLSEASWIFFGARSGPRSRGRILLTGADPNDRVRIDANALSDPEDLESAKPCIEFMREIGSAAVLQPHIKREVMPGDLTGTDLEAYIRDAVDLLAPGRYGQDGQRLHIGGRRPSQGLWSREPSSRRRLHHAEDNDGQHNGTVRSDRRTSSGTAHQRAPAVTAARSYRACTDAHPNLPAPSSISSSDDTRT